MGTVVLVDVVSSTNLESTGLLELMEMVAASARARNSDVVKILGDCVISVFSSPSQAIEFAISIHEDFQNFDLESVLLSETKLRVGVATGELVVVDADVFGSAINIALRLRQRAGVGQTLCDEATATLAGELSGLQKTLEGRWSLKGFSGRLQVYSLSPSLGTNEPHIEILKQGVDVWNQWRERNFTVEPNLARANLSGLLLIGADLRKTNLTKANLTETNLSEANLTRANLTGATLTRANLVDSNLTGAILQNTDVSKALIGGTTFSGNDLSGVKGLSSVRHIGPSNVSIDTLYTSGKLSAVFLRGCGLPESIISNLPVLISSESAIQFYSCFLSYSHKDEEFARRLYTRMREAHIRVWFAPEEIRGGETLSKQIDRAIQLHDRLLVVLSSNSLKSEWMMTEIRKARTAEYKEKRRKLFPIRLVNIETILEWECYDRESGKDFAVELREYFIPDFSNWRDADAFETAFNKLLIDLKAAEIADE